MWGTPGDDSQPLCYEYHYVQSKVPAMTFTAEDMLRKDNKHDRPLYYTRYVGLTCIERIQVDPGSALSIIPKRLLYFLGIPLYRLSVTTTTIYSFNAGSSHPLGKIRLRCRIGDLKSEVTCYWHIIQLIAWTTLDPCQLDRSFYSAPVLQVCRR